MVIEEVKITKSIMEAYFEDLSSSLELDVAIAGAGPSGMVAAYYLAKSGVKTALFERRLSIGGGMWGGGMMFNQITVQEQGKDILDEFGVRSRSVGDGLFVANSVESTTAICLEAMRAGAKVFNLITIEDVVIRDESVEGLVINWSAVDVAGLHVDPMVIMSRKTIDATGHDSEICRVVERKVGPNLQTPSGKVSGESSMWAEEGEASLVDNSVEVYPNLYVAGMAANAVFGSPRMGPIFGGMLMSGRACARRISRALEEGS